MPTRLPAPLPPPADVITRRPRRHSLLCTPLRRDDGGLALTPPACPWIAGESAPLLTRGAAMSVAVRCCQLAATPVAGASIPLAMTQPVASVCTTPRAPLRPLPVSPRVLRPLSGATCARKHAASQHRAQSARAPAHRHRHDKSCDATVATSQPPAPAAAAESDASRSVSAAGSNGSSPIPPTPSDPSLGPTPNTAPPLPSPPPRGGGGSGRRASEPRDAFSRLYDPKHRERRQRQLSERYAGRYVIDEHRDKLKATTERFFDRPAGRCAGLYD
jgi:hypothetical protein